ncbi:MAG: toll/interleukin-1 receptor domain-containing protein, partial [Pseudomonadota bacterium]
MATARETIVQTDEPPVVFVSYSHEDEEWKDKLRPHLKALEVKGRLTLWDDRKLNAGDEWYAELRENMEKAGVAVCLISPDFLASDFCMKEEVAHFVSQREEHGMSIIPILVRPCLWKVEDWLSGTQMIPRDGMSLALNFPNEAEQDQQLAMVAETIFEILDDPNYRPPPPPAPAFPALPEACIDVERLPVTGKELFGRQVELQMLDEAWASDGTNIVALTAWGGVGKSTLVNRWVERLGKDNYRGAERVFAWSFYSQGMRDQVASADAFIDEALRFFEDDDPSKGSPWAKGERLAELVGKQKALLLLDGMEPLQDPYQGIKDPALARLVECLAVENAGLCVITTREKVKELDDFPDQVIEQDLEHISPEAGRALLRVKRVRGSDAALEQASRNFGNHALAINLLASYLQFYDNRHISQAATIPDLPDLEDPHHRHPRRVMANSRASSGYFEFGWH